MTINEAKKIVLETAKKAFDAKLFAGTSGNLSVFLRDDETVVITPTSIRYEDMAIEDIVIIDLEGNIIEGKHKPSSEHLLHCEIYKNKAKANAVVHTHSPYATAFAVNNQPIPLVLVEMIAFLGGEVPVAGLAVPGSDAVGQNAVKALQDPSVACLLANHGVVIFGETMPQAYLRAEYVEDAAKICTIAKQNGELVLISKEGLEKLRGK